MTQPTFRCATEKHCVFDFLKSNERMNGARQITKGSCVRELCLWPRADVGKGSKIDVD